MVSLGAIGYGLRADTVMRRLLAQERGAVLAAVCDPDPARVRERLAATGLDPSSVRFVDDPDDLLDAGGLDGVLVATRCSLHAREAVRVLRRGLPLFLEKPVATRSEDLDALDPWIPSHDARTVVSFPLRASPLLQEAARLVRAGILGEPAHAVAWNDVPYGGVYYHDWYRDEAETGGLFLQKATHDLDALRCLLPGCPVEVAAMASKQVYRGDRPAGLRCGDCPDRARCPEGPVVSATRAFDAAHDGYAVSDASLCCFAADTGNEDSGSALVRFEGGLHAAYSQDFLARKGAARRGGRIFSHEATLAYEWYGERATIHWHRTERVDEIRFDRRGGGHFGGDDVLAANFLDVCEGRAASISPLSAGIASARLCLAARESARTGRFVPVPETPSADGAGFAPKEDAR